MALEYVGGAGADGINAPFDVSLTALTGGIGTAAQPGDLIVVATAYVTQNAPTTPDAGVQTAGYADLWKGMADDNRETHFAVACKVLTVAETTVTCIGSQMDTQAAEAVVHVWRGADAASPMDVPVVGTTMLDGRSIDSPAVTPITPGAVVLTMGATTSAGMLSGTAPAGYGNAVTACSDPGSAVFVGVASKAWTDGTEDPGTWGALGGSAADGWVGATLAIRPAGPPQEGLTGSGATIEAGTDTSTGAAGVAVVGSGAPAEAGQDTASGSAGAAISGGGAAAESATDSSFGSGTAVWATITGSGAAIEAGRDTVAGAGSAAWPGIIGTGATVETGGDTATGAGTVIRPGAAGSGAVLEVGRDTAAGAGAIVWTGAAGLGATVEAGTDTAAGAGAVGIIIIASVSETGIDIAQGAGIAAMLMGRAAYPGQNRAGHLVNGGPRGGTIVRG